ncbi:MAG: GvpL/GvpF family gas vesicle protein [Pseudomonadota bacterium]
MIGYPLAITAAASPAAPRRAVAAAGLTLYLGATPALGPSLALRLGRDRACLPVGRGHGPFESAAAARRWLSERAEALRAQLEWIGARAEFVLSLECRDPLARARAPRDELSGAAYLRAAAASRAAESAAARRFDECVEAVRAALRAEAPAAPQSLARLRPGAVDVSLLGPPALKQRLAAAAPALAARFQPVLRLTGSGPWPPYSFVEIAAGPPRGEAA